MKGKILSKRTACDPESAAGAPRKFRRAVRLLTMALAATCLSLAFAGCDGSTTSGGGDGEEETLVIFAPTLIIKEDSERREEYQRIFKEAVGCNVEFVTPPLTGFEEKLGIMLTSQEQIDVIWTTGVPSIIHMVNQSFLLPIDEYVEQSEFLNSDEYLARDAIDTTAVEGQVYGIPYKMPMGYVPIINKAWLDKLGLPVPTTFDELNTALRAFVDNDMGGGLTIGTTQQYPYVEQIASYLGFFGVQGGHVTRNENGERFHPFLTENGRQGLLWLQQLYADGILDKEFPTVTESAMRQKLANGNIGMTFEWPAGTEEINKKAQVNGKGDNVNMVAMEPVSALPDTPAYIPGHTLVSWVMSSTTENPDLAFKLIEYLVSPEAVAALGMEEGLDYEVVDGQQVLLDTAAGIVVQQSALSPFKDLQTGIRSTPETVREMEILNAHLCHLPWERENSETDQTASRNILKCITGQMSVDDYLTDLRDELMKFKLIDISEI